MLEKRLNKCFIKLQSKGVTLGNALKDNLTKLVEHLESVYKMDTQVPGHEFEHMFRVLELSILLCSRIGCDVQMISYCAMLHDIARMLDPEIGNHAEESARLAPKILRELFGDDFFSKIDMERLQSCIREHSFSSGLSASSLESMILQDADRLDALGALGVARVFAYGGFLRRPIYDMIDPIRGNGSLKHFYDKILNLLDTMNTDIAREIAKRRITFVKNFIKELLKEIDLGDV